MIFFFSSRRRHTRLTCDWSSDVCSSDLLLGQYASPADVGRSIAAYRAAVEASGRRFDPMQVGVTRAFFVADTAAEKETALERRLANRVRQLKLATRPDGTVHGGPDRATGDPDTVNRNSAMYGSPDDIAEKLGELRRVGVGYVLVNGGGSGGGQRGRASLRRFAAEAMPHFADARPAEAIGRQAAEWTEEEDADPQSLHGRERSVAFSRHR